MSSRPPPGPSQPGWQVRRPAGAVGPDRPFPPEDWFQPDRRPAQASPPPRRPDEPSTPVRPGGTTDYPSKLPAGARRVEPGRQRGAGWTDFQHGFSDPGPATLPLPAIDLADFEASAAVARDGDVAALLPSPASQAGLASVARGGALNLAGALVAAVGTLGLTVVVTRNFSPPIAGVFFTAISMFLIVEAVANLGAYNGAIYFIARLRALGAERRIPAILRATILPVLVASLVAAALMIVFAVPMARLLTRGQGVSVTAVAGAVRAMAFAMPFAAMTDTLLGASRGYRAMRPTVLVDRIGRSTLQLAGAVAAVLAGAAPLLAPLWALPYVPACVVALVWLQRIMRRQRQLSAATQPDMAGNAPGPAGIAAGTPVRSPAGTLNQPPGSAPLRPPDGGRAGQAAEPAPDNRHGRPNARGFWRFTAPRSLASAAQIIIQRLDILLVALFLGFPQAAIYMAATRFLVAGQLGNAAISMAAQPQFTHLFALGDRRGANAVYQVTTGWLVMLTWPLYLIVIVFGPAVLAVFGHGGQYQTHDAATVMIILAVTMLVATGCGQVDMVLITTGRSSWSLANGLVAMAANVTVDLALIPRIGITGAAIGWAAAILLSNLAPLIQIACAYRLQPFGRGTMAACLLTLASFGLVPVLVRQLAQPLHASHLAVVTAGVAAGCALMTVGLWLLRDLLQLSVMPGLSGLLGRRRER